MSRWFSDAAARRTSTSPGPGAGSGHVLVAQDFGAAVLVDPDRLHGAILAAVRVPSDRMASLPPRGLLRVTAAFGADADCEGARDDRCELSGPPELGIDVIGAARAEPYEETERAIRERRSRGLFADMRFTMAQPEVSCHPERLLPGARPWSPRRSATTHPARSRCRAREDPALYVAGRLRGAARKLDELGRRLGGSTASSSTRTSTSTGRARRGPALASTARTRC